MLSHFFLPTTAREHGVPFTLGVEEPMDNAGMGPAEGPSKSPHGLNHGKKDPNTEKKNFFYALGYPSGILTHW